MKRLPFLWMLVLLSLVTSVYSVDYLLDVGDSVNSYGKLITLTNVGSTDSIVVDVNGISCIISSGNTETCNGIEITNDEAFYTSIAKEQNSARIDVFKEGQICYDDDICEFKDLGYLRTGDSVIFRGKTIKIIENNGEKITLKIDGVTETLLSAHKARLEKKPPESMKVINGIGFRLLEDTTNLLIGENYENCESDCSLDVQDEYNYKGFIEGLCSNEKKDKFIEETDEDCGGNYCGKCDYGSKCKVNRDCKVKDYCFDKEKVCCPRIELVECSGYLVDDGVDEYGCELNPTCCGDNVCNGLENEIACPIDCKTEEIVKEETTEEDIELIIANEKTTEENMELILIPKFYDVYSDYNNKKCVIYIGENKSLEYYDICSDDCENTLSECNKKFEEETIKVSKEKSVTQKIFSWFNNLF